MQYSNLQEFNNNEHTIDILLATYNGENYIREQLDSLLTQTFSDFQILIRDDGSTDKTIEILNEYCKKNPQKIFLIKDDARCGSAEKNFMRLITYATAPYVMFCDQDDIWFEKKVEVTYKKMCKCEVDKIPLLVYTDYVQIDDESNVLPVEKQNNQTYNPKLNLESLLVQNYVTGCTMMVNKHLYSKIKEYQKGILMHDWWLTIYASAFGRVYHLDQETMYYRQHAEQSVGAVDIRSMSYIISKIKSRDTKDSMNKYVIQAQLFYEQYKNEMDEKTRSRIKTFISIPKKNKVERIYTLLKYGYLKNTFARIVGQLFYV